jgi:hypothetical protein
MKRAITVNADYRFMSALVDKDTASALRVGDQVQAHKALDVDYLGAVPAGEKATVTYVCPESGLVEITFDTVLEQLHDWHNILLLMPYDTDTWIAGLELVSCWEAKEIKAA